MEDKSFGRFFYTSEYAKSGRAGCKLCKGLISEGSLRLSILVQSPFFDGKVPNWYHFGCFFKKAKCKDPGEIKGYDCLRYEDQQKIKSKLGLETSNDDIKENEDNESNEITVENFSIEYAKSARAKCKKCENKISKNELRVSFEDGWLHLDCFARNKSEYKFNFNPEEIGGFDELKDEDKQKAKQAIGLPKRKNEEENSDAKKVKSEPNSKSAQLKTQSIKFWKLRDTLADELPNELLKILIEENDQKCVVTGRDNMLLFLTDIMMFGPLEPCPECKNGQLIYKGSGYYCTGDLTEWTKCLYKTQEPKRRKIFDIKKDYLEYSCLKSFKFEPNQIRVFEKTLEEANKLQIKQEANAVDPKRPLKRMDFALSGKLSLKNNEIKQLIERLGGKLVTHVDDTTVAMIANSDHLEKMNKKIQQSQTSDVHVVDETFLDELKSLKAESIVIEDLISKHNIGKWGSDLKNRIQMCVGNNELQEKLKKDSNEKRYSSKSSGTVKVKVKGGAAVDLDSGLEDECHVYSEKNEPYSCVLGYVDIARGTNSYYKLQLIEHDKKSKYYVFRAWGRVGTTIGGNKLTDYNSKSQALQEFCEVYLKQTGNEWEYRKTAGKKPNKFYPLEMDYGEDDENDENLKLSDHVSSSTLAKPIQQLIQLIFDIETMKRQMKEFEIDLNKMPLGKISSNQIKMAFSILTELNDLIDKKGSDTRILDASNRFYTLIPHDFGLKTPTLLNKSELIKEKTEMLNNLLEIEIAYNIIKTDSSSDEDPIDQHYKRLKCDMEVLEKECDEYKRLLKYVANTHASTHSSYSLNVKDIFKVKREGEFEKYEQYKSLHNKKLLWHGSRLTNFAGILSQGLRIAPPEAPCTGYMFGKGVYFADMVSKSANYCFTSSANPTGLLLLCEVALGDMYEKTSSEYVTKLPTGKHSTKGCGRTHPNPSEALKLEDGVEIPLGTGTDSGISYTSLLYNEYIVYDIAQINIKYLLRVDFEYKW